MLYDIDFVDSDNGWAVGKAGEVPEAIRKGIGADPRIGPKFLFAGAGFGVQYAVSPEAAMVIEIIAPDAPDMKVMDEGCSCSAPETFGSGLPSALLLLGLAACSSATKDADLDDTDDSQDSDVVDTDVGETDGVDTDILGEARPQPGLNIGYLPQEASIFRGMTVEDNIRAILEVSTRDRGLRQRELESLLGEFSITHLRNSPAIALSGGERRRVEIARCLASFPKYVLLDEPFAGVDPIAVGEIRHLVSDLKNRGIGVLITDHNVQETLQIVDRAYILHDGKVLMSGTTQEVVKDDNVRRVYLGNNFRVN